MTEEARNLVNALREDAEWAHANEWETPITLGDNLDTAAYLIESLSAQLDQATRERDAAVKGLARYRRCIDCARYDEEVVKTSTLCDDCSFGSKWQWRGAEKEVEG